MNSLEIFNKHKEAKPSIVTIGTFDGIHEGHTSLLTNMINNKNNLIPIVISFNKSPKDIINKKNSKMIFELNEKKKIIQEIGMEKIIDIDFNQEIQELNCKDFIEILKYSLNMEVLILGEDTLLGKDRKNLKKLTHHLKAWMMKNNCQIFINQKKDLDFLDIFFC